MNDDVASGQSVCPHGNQIVVAESENACRYSGGKKAERFDDASAGIEFCNVKGIGWPTWVTGCHQISRVARPGIQQLPVIRSHLYRRAGRLARVRDSKRKSEIAFYNASNETRHVVITRQMPFIGGVCFFTVPIPPGESRLGPACQISIALPGAGAVEITADSSVDIRHRIVNTSPVAAGRGEYSQAIPMERLAEAYSTARLIYNLRPLMTFSGFAVRQNLGIVNPNERPLVVKTTLRPPSDYDVPDVLTDLLVPARSLRQFNDFLTQPAPSFRGVSGAWTLVAEADLPFYAYVSEVDNTLNDATFFRSIDVSASPPQ